MTSHYEYALVLVRAYNARTESITYFRIGMGWIPSERILTSTSKMQHPIAIQHSTCSHILHDIILSQYLYVHPHMSYCTHAYASNLHKSKYNILCPYSYIYQIWKTCLFENCICISVNFSENYLVYLFKNCNFSVSIS